MGVVLLEVVLALTLFAATAITVLAGVNFCFRVASEIELDAQAADLAISKFSELQMDPELAVDDGPNEYEEPELEGWTWEIATSSVEIELESPSFKEVEITISYPPEAYSHTLRFLTVDPETEEEFVAEDGQGQRGPR